MKFVVDTNVPVVANGKSEQASSECVKTCAVRLNKLTRNSKLVLDNGWLILREYMANLKSSGQPGLGDAFLKWVLTNYKNPNRCELVTITPIDSSFSEFPSLPALQNFDPNDKKFIAVANAHSDKPTILQAVDTEWWSMRDFLQQAGITVDFLCVEDIKAAVMTSGGECR